MEEDDLMRGVQPEADASLLGGLERLEEAIPGENLAHPWPVILDLDDRDAAAVSLRLGSADADLRACARRGLEGVVKNAGQCITEVVGITPDAGRIVERGGHAERAPISAAQWRHLRAMQHLLDQIIQIERDLDEHPVLVRGR